MPYASDRLSWTPSAKHCHEIKQQCGRCIYFLAYKLHKNGEGPQKCHLADVVNDLLNLKGPDNPDAPTKRWESISEERKTYVLGFFSKGEELTTDELAKKMKRSKLVAHQAVIALEQRGILERFKEGHTRKDTFKFRLKKGEVDE